ncbi:MAG: YIP1 family protein, partial [Lautropia sp.]|nr:YIP1 family protein [Lautropia sp.]
MNLLARVKGILLAPSTEWPLIDQESHTVKDLYLSYLLPLAGIGALATLIGTMLFGYSAGPVTVRYGFGDAVGLALVGLVMSMVVVFVLGWIIDALAPTFKGQKNFLKAFAVAAFSMTGALVGSFASILPALGWLFGLLGGLYSIYLLYKGLPVLMKAPTDKAVGYTVVIVIASIVCNVILTALFASLLPNPWSSVGAGLGRGTGSEITITTPAGQVATTQGRLEEESRQLEAAAQKVEQASQNQDPQAVSKAAIDAVAAVTGA